MPLSARWIASTTAGSPETCRNATLRLVIRQTRRVLSPVARPPPVAEVTRTASVLAFDHHEILADGVERARAKLEYTGYAAALCGETFTIADLHAVYEAVWGVALDRANFHRKVTGVAGFLTATGERREGGRGRPARVYRADPLVVLSPPILRADR